MIKTFTCYNSARQPTIKLGLFDECYALIDTGSMITTWIKDEGTLLSIGAKPTGETHTVYTAGDRVLMPVYRLNFQIDEIFYPDMPVTLNTMDVKKVPGLANVYFILGAPMFRGTIYTIDTINGRFILNIPDDQPGGIFTIK